MSDENTMNISVHAIITHVVIFFHIANYQLPQWKCQGTENLKRNHNVDVIHVKVVYGVLRHYH